MAMWDSKQGKIIYFDPEPVDGYDGWEWIDCGCCGGIQWGGEEPRECDSCNGTGQYCRHKKSGVHAMYPGGPFV